MSLVIHDLLDAVQNRQDNIHCPRSEADWLHQCESHTRTKDVLLTPSEVAEVLIKRAAKDGPI